MIKITLPLVRSSSSRKDKLRLYILLVIQLVIYVGLCWSASFLEYISAATGRTFAHFLCFRCMDIICMFTAIATKSCSGCWGWRRGLWGDAGIGSLSGRCCMLRSTTTNSWCGRFLGLWGHMRLLLLMLSRGREWHCRYLGRYSRSWRWHRRIHSPTSATPSTAVRYDVTR